MTVRHRGTPEIKDGMQKKGRDTEKTGAIHHATRYPAFGSQTFIVTLLFGPSMSALPIILKQNSVSVGLFTH